MKQLVVTVGHPLGGGRQAGTVRRHAGDLGADGGDDRLGLGVDLQQPADHGLVVDGVGVVVGVAVAQLPVAAQLLEGLVEARGSSG